jgi:hypothetical protein
MTGRYIDLLNSTLSHRLKIGGQTLGMGHDFSEEKKGAVSIYSIGLNALIKECLLIQPSSRPSPESLFARTKRGLQGCHKEAGTSPSLHTPSVRAENGPSSRWFEKGPHPIASDRPEPQCTIPLSDFIQRVKRVKLDKDLKINRKMVERQRSFTNMLNRGQDHSPSFGQWRSIQRLPNLFSKNTEFGGVPESNPITSPGVRAAGALAGAAADIGMGIGAGLGLDLGIVKEQLQGGVNAGAHRLAEAFRTPPHERSDEWQALAQETKGKRKAPASPGPPPDEAQIIPIPVLYCIVKHVGAFGQVNHAHHKLTGLFNFTTILQLKAKLLADGVGIAMNRMKVTSGIQVLNNDDTLAALNGENTVRVEKE